MEVNGDRIGGRWTAKPGQYRAPKAARYRERCHAGVPECGGYDAGMGCFRRIALAVLPILTACQTPDSGEPEPDTQGTITPTPGPEGDTKIPPGEGDEPAAAPEGPALITHADGSITHRATGLHFVPIEPGTFVMGSQQLASVNGPSHSVTLTQKLYIADTEVTVRAWNVFVTATGFDTSIERAGTALTLGTNEWRERADASWRDPFPTLRFRLTERHPVVFINYDEALAFCEHFGFRLPTEAEWECCCRAGTLGEFPWGDTIAGGEKYGNFADATLEELNAAAAEAEGFTDGTALLAEVKSKEPNALGLYDMLGNVWEWCRDGFERYSPDNVSDPLITTGRGMVVRGGSWADGEDETGSAIRSLHERSHASPKLGFRVVLGK